MRRGVEHARHAGELLLAAKAQLSHGEWLPWLEANCQVSARSAQGYMRLARQWPTLAANAQRVADFGDLPLRSALALLADQASETNYDDQPAEAIHRATWMTAKVADLLVTDDGWRYDDPMLLKKLTTSLKRHGQMRPLIVRHADDGASVVVDGRMLLRAMRASGWETAWVVDIGVIDDQDAQHLHLDLEICFQTNYAKLAHAVAGIAEAGTSHASLAAGSPFDEVRIGHFVGLTKWDWSRFGNNGEPIGARAVEPAEGAESAAPSEKHRCPRCAYEWSGSARPYAVSPGQGRVPATSADEINRLPVSQPIGKLTVYGDGKDTDPSVPALRPQVDAAAARRAHLPQVQERAVGRATAIAAGGAQRPETDGEAGKEAQRRKVTNRTAARVEGAQAALNHQP